MLNRTMAALGLAITLQAPIALAQSSSWTKITPEQSDLVLSIAEISGILPLLSERMEPSNVRGSTTVTVAVDRFRYENAGSLLLAFREYHDEGLGSWDQRDVRRFLDEFQIFRGNNVAVYPSHHYGRDGGSGEFVRFSYKPSSTSRECVYTRLHFTGRGAERLTTVFCWPENKTIVDADARRVADSVGSKRHPPVVAAMAPPRAAPAPSPPAASPTAGSTADRLKALKDLYDQKLINQIEYEQKRKAIIDGL